MLDRCFRRDVLGLGNSELSHLETYEEVLGPLHEVLVDKGLLIARIGKLHIILPGTLEEWLRAHTGERVGILRTDSLENQYRFKVIR
jgi:hypothetical protein